MELWIPITIFAAFCQNLRSALQKTLKSTLSTWGATGARFIYAAPLAIMLLVSVSAGTEQPLSGFVPQFFVYGIIGGIAQILATGLLIHLFSFQNFTVATTLTKTEPIQVAIFGIILLGDQISLAAVITIMISLLGVGLISIPRDRLQGESLFDRKAFLGIAAGALFGLSAVAYRGASLSLLDGSVLLRAATTLAFVTSSQALIILAWIAAKESEQLALLIRSWKVSASVGLVGMLGSLAWFTAFTLENATYVRVVGQIEIIFMIGASVLMFREKVSARELIGLALVTSGIVGLVLLK